MISPIILSGGSGTRLWPYSRSQYPKQFLPLTSDSTMLQQTIGRLQQFDKLKESISSPIIICNEDHRFIVAEQLRAINISPCDILLEPFGRNTAPAIALAALSLVHKDQADSLMLVLPADHVIQNIPAFEVAIKCAVNQAEAGKLVTFGIVPTAPETGYGYIKTGNKINKQNAFDVEQFVEKPDLETAKIYVDSGDFLWNSGMFLFKASRYLRDLEKFNPNILSCCKNAINQSTSDLDFTRISPEDFAGCPNDSIDYAVMEKTTDAVIVPLDAQWSDVGSWSALWEVSEQDIDGNVLKKGDGDIIALDSTNCFIQAENKLIATIGLSDAVVVETDDAIMVANKDRVQDIKKIVEQLKDEERSECSLHRKVYRPWGYYDSIDAGKRFQVKRIVVNPGAQLSLQMHHHRAEHWVIVEGTAKVRCGEKTMLLSENQSTYIPLGEVHQLSNPGKCPLEIIEVQSGSYLGEDDIVRLEDIYGRK